jgi:hypothetical protein
LIERFNGRLQAISAIDTYHLSNSFETAHGFDPRDSGHASIDSDGDGIGNDLNTVALEYVLQGQSGNADQYLLESQAGLALKLGDIAQHA